MKHTFAETVSQLLPCILGHFRYSAGTHVSSVVAYSDFTSKFPDYVLSKASLFSTKLSLPELCYLQDVHKIAIFLVASLDLVTMRVSARARWGKRWRTIVVQSRDSENAQRNLEIVRNICMG